MSYPKAKIKTKAKAKVKGLEVDRIINKALREDIGRKDITTELFIPKTKHIKAILLAKEDCIVCGLEIAKRVFKTRDKNIKFRAVAREGQRIKKDEVIARVWGRAPSILTAERVALNFLGLLSGIATRTREYVEAVKPYKVNPALSTRKSRHAVRKGGVKIMDTRKTIPGLRGLEKYAVRVGGGYNHRFRLDEMVLVKDNHLKIQNPKGPQQKLGRVEGGLESKIQNLVKLIKKAKKISKQIEIEVQNLKEFKQVLKLKPDIIMLDNMDIKDIKKAVEIRNNLSPATYNLRPKLEVSGGITLKNLRGFASTGVNMISIGQLTHSVRSIDMSLEVL